MLCGYRGRAEVPLRSCLASALDMGGWVVGKSLAPGEELRNPMSRTIVDQ